jgi:hypothetical protein
LPRTHKKGTAGEELVRMLRPENTKPKVVAGGSVFVGQKRNEGTRWSEMVTETGGGSVLEVCDEENRDRD